MYGVKKILLNEILIYLEYNNHYSLRVKHPTQECNTSFLAAIDSSTFIKDLFQSLSAVEQHKYLIVSL